MPARSADVDQIESVRLCLYRSLATRGTLPDHYELLEVAGSEEQLAGAITTLAEQRHVALDGDCAIVLAHPFATRSFGFSVMSEQTLWWGGCAWDSFALPHVVGVDDVLVSTRCPACDRALAWVVGTAAPPIGDEVAHFLVPAHQMWDDVIHTCSNQLLFCGHDCVDRWLERSRLASGFRMDLMTLWRFAAHWYDGRLGRGYVRRNPADAREYLASVGLSGAFWGL